MKWIDLVASEKISKEKRKKLIQEYVEVNRKETAKRILEIAKKNSSEASLAPWQTWQTISINKLEEIICKEYGIESEGEC